MLRALIDARRIAVNEQLNSIVIRDTADKVAIAERLIDANDKAKAEVLIDVELIQVDSNASCATSAVAAPTYGRLPVDAGSNLRVRLGDQLPDPARPSLATSPAVMWGMTVPVGHPAARSSRPVRPRRSPSRSSASPRARRATWSSATGCRSRPRPSTRRRRSAATSCRSPRSSTRTSASRSTSSRACTTTTRSPLKLKVEVSELGDKVDVGNGNMQPKIGTRTIDSMIRLKDGETSLLAGLLKYRKGNSRTGIPCLSDLPILGPLFRGNSAIDQDRAGPDASRPTSSATPTSPRRISRRCGSAPRTGSRSSATRRRALASSGSPFGEQPQPRPARKLPTRSNRPRPPAKDDRRLTSPPGRSSSRRRRHRRGQDSVG